MCKGLRRDKGGGKQTFTRIQRQQVLHKAGLRRASGLVLSLLTCPTQSGVKRQLKHSPKEHHTSTQTQVGDGCRTHKIRPTGLSILLELEPLSFLLDLDLCVSLASSDDLGIKGKTLI